jgi:hypothetical protein
MSQWIRRKDESVDELIGQAADELLDESMK